MYLYVFFSEFLDTNNDPWTSNIPEAVNTSRATCAKLTAQYTLIEPF